MSWRQPVAEVGEGKPSIIVIWTWGMCENKPFIAAIDGEKSVPDATDAHRWCVCSGGTDGGEGD